MFCSENLTNRELLSVAMPLRSLSRKQWNDVVRHVENVECSEGNESTLVTALRRLCLNQARIEVMSNYTEYYSDTMEEQVCENSYQLEL